MARLSNKSQNIVPETEKAIHDAAVVLFAVKGFRETKTKEIAELAGVSKSMMHYYYSTKENLFRVLIREGIALFINAVHKSEQQPPVPKERIKVFLQTYFENFKSHRELSRIILREIIAGGELILSEVRKHFVQRFNHLSQVINPTGELIGGNNLFLAYTLFGMATMFIAGHFTSARDIDPALLSEQISELFLNGALKR